MTRWIMQVKNAGNLEEFLLVEAIMLEELLQLSKMKE